MSKMLFEPWVATCVAKAKEDMGVNSIWKYLRYYRMFLERFIWKSGKNDLSHQIEKTLFWRGQCAIVKSSLYGAVVIEIDDKSKTEDPNGNIITVSGTSETGKKFKNLEVGKDCIILYSDSTRLPPVLYLWAMSNNILDTLDIIKQQNNMLRKPIMVAGEGASFDNAVNKVMNVLSGVAWFNFNDRKGKGNSMIPEQPVEVLNLQVGNAYKGIELWDNVKHYEEYICDYLGYTTTKNEKRERMNTLEIENENSIGVTMYKAQVKERENAVKQAKEIGLDLTFGKLLDIEEGGEDNDSKENLDRNTPTE